MNNERRKEIKKIIHWLDKIEGLRDKPLLDAMTCNLDNVLSDEQEMYDNIPENLQNGENAMKSEESIEAMEEALDLLNQANDEEDEEEYLTKIQEAIIELEVI